MLKGYISKQELYDTIDGGYDIDFDELPETKAAILESIERFSTADVRENVRGKWIKDEYGYLVCSECENEMPTLWSQGRIPKWTVRYCYYCGAAMT